MKEVVLMSLKEMDRIQTLKQLHTGIMVVATSKNEALVKATIVP